MSFYTAVVLGFVIFVPALLAFLRFKQIHCSYYPFIYLLWIGSLNELITFLLLMNHLPNAVSSNIYVLVESLLIVSFFRNYQVLRGHDKVYKALLVLITSTWLFETLVINSANEVSVYFRILYSFIVVILSISIINISLTDTRVSVLKNSDFLICACFILFFTYKIMVEMFWLYGLNTSSRFQLLIYDILNYINLFCNIVFMFAVLWMPKKQVFTMRY